MCRGPREFAHCNTCNLESSSAVGDDSQRLFDGSALLIRNLRAQRVNDKNVGESSVFERLPYGTLLARWLLCLGRIRTAGPITAPVGGPGPIR